MEDGELTGIVNSRALHTEDEIRNISINGKAFYRSAVVSLSDFRHGRLINLGKARIKLNRKNINWKLLKGDEGHFPSYAILWKNIVVL